MAIYGTLPHTVCCEGPTKIIPGDLHADWPLFTAADFRFTRSPRALFVLAFAWPANNSLGPVRTLNASAPLSKSVTGVSLVGSTCAVGWSVAADGLRLSTAGCSPTAAPAYTFRLQLDGATAEQIDEPTRALRERIVGGTPAGAVVEDA